MTAARASGHCYSRRLSRAAAMSEVKMLRIETLVYPPPGRAKEPGSKRQITCTKPSCLDLRPNQPELLESLPYPSTFHKSFRCGHSSPFGLRGSSTSTRKCSECPATLCGRPWLRAMRMTRAFGIESKDVKLRSHILPGHGRPAVPVAFKS